MPSTPPAAPPAGPGRVSRPNEPSGFESIVSIGFADSLEADIGDCDLAKRTSGNTTLVTDATAPTGDGSVLRIRFPAGKGDGGAPARLDCWKAPNGGGRPEEYEEIYISFRLKVEGSDYENQSNGTKVFYWAYGAAARQNDGYLMLHNGTGARAIQDEMVLVAKLSENAPEDTSAKTQFGTGDPEFTVGDWHHVELHARINDVGADDGTLRLWVDGTQTHDIAGWTYRSVANDRAFYHFQLTPVWGGNSGDVRTREDYWRVDEVYVSAPSE